MVEGCCDADLPPARMGPEKIPGPGTEVQLGVAGNYLVIILYNNIIIGKNQPEL